MILHFQVLDAFETNETYGDLGWLNQYGGICILDLLIQ